VDAAEVVDLPVAFENFDDAGELGHASETIRTMARINSHAAATQSAIKG
jgi:hypothetical protein